MIDVSEMSGPLGGSGGAGLQVKPHTALVFSSVSEGRLGAGAMQMVARHDIEVLDGRPSMGVGHLVNEDDVDDLLRQLRTDKAAGRSPFLPAELVGLSSGFAAWCVEGKQRPMWFRIGEKASSLAVVWPHLIVAVAQEKVCVCAVAAPVVRGEDVPVFHAPLMNIYADGRVCMPGGIRVPPGLDGREAAEKVVFDTAFSHVNHGQTIRVGRGTKRKIDTAALHAFWTRRVGSKGAPAERLLTPMKMTLSQWLAHIAR